MGNNKQKPAYNLSGNKILDYTKKILTMVANSSALYYMFVGLLCIEILLQAIRYGDPKVSGIYFLVFLGWKIYRMKHGYKSFSFKLLKKSPSSKLSTTSNEKKKTDRNKGYKLIDK